MLPELDLQTWRLPSCSEWTAPCHPRIQVALGWEREPLWVEQGDMRQSLVTDLMHVNAGIVRVAGPWYFAAELPFSGVWNGEVGLANPRATAGWRSGPLNLNVTASSPWDTLDTPISEPTWTASAYGSVGGSWGLVGGYLGLGGTYRPEGAYGHEGLVRGGVKLGPLLLEGVGAKGLGEFGAVRGEARASALVPMGAITVTPTIGTALTAAPGNPRLRALVLISRGALPSGKKVPILPVEVSPPQAPAPQVTPPSVSAEPAPPPAPPEPPPAPAPPAPTAPPVRVMVQWAEVEVHPPCGRKDGKLWMEPRLEAVRTVLEKQGITRDHVEVTVGTCSAKPNIRVKPEKREQKLPQ